MVEQTLAFFNTSGMLLGSIEQFLRVLLKEELCTIGNNIQCFSSVRWWLTTKLKTLHIIMYLIFVAVVFTIRIYSNSMHCSPMHHWVFITRTWCFYM